MGAFHSCLDAGQHADRKKAALQVSVQGQLPAHRGKPHWQQGPAAAVELPKELERVSQKTRALERGLPGSLSSPSLLAEVPEKSEAADKSAAEQTKETAAGKIHRAMSLGQTPAVLSRMTSWKDASKDYSAMQAALQNFPDHQSEQHIRATSVPSQSAPLQKQDRELSSAPELFTDAAMRNALRKIAALQAKPQPRSRASSARTSALNSALNSSHVSSEGDAVFDAAVTAASRDGSPGGFDAAHSRFMQDALKGRASYNNDLSGLPAGSRAASSDAGSRMGSRPPSTDAYHRGHPASSFNRTNDMFSGQRSRQTSSEILLAQPSRPTSVDAQHGGFSSRGPSADLDQRSHHSSAQQQRSSSEALGAMRRAPSDDALPLQHSQAPAFVHQGPLRQEPGLADIPELASRTFSNDRSASGAFDSPAGRQWGSSVGMRRVPENKAAEAFEVLMSKAQGSDTGSLNSEDTATVNAYVRDSLAGVSDGRLSMDSGNSVESVGKLDGSAVVHAADAHAALKRALSLVKRQEAADGRPPGEDHKGSHPQQSQLSWEWEVQQREQSNGPPRLQAKSRMAPGENHEGPSQQSQSSREWEAKQREQRASPQQVSGKQRLAVRNGLVNGYGPAQSDAAIQAFVCSAFSTPSQRSSADSQGG